MEAALDVAMLERLVADNEAQDAKLSTEFDAIRKDQDQQLQALRDTRAALKMQIYLKLHKTRAQVYARVLRDCRDPKKIARGEAIKVPVPPAVRAYHSQCYQWFRDELEKDGVELNTYWGESYNADAKEAYLLFRLESHPRRGLPLAFGIPPAQIVDMPTDPLNYPRDPTIPITFGKQP